MFPYLYPRGEESNLNFVCVPSSRKLSRLHNFKNINLSQKHVWAFQQENISSFCFSSCRFSSAWSSPANGDEIHKRVKNILRTHSARQRLVFVSLTANKILSFLQDCWGRELCLQSWFFHNVVLWGSLDCRNMNSVYKLNCFTLISAPCMKPLWRAGIGNPLTGYWGQLRNFLYLLFPLPVIAKNMLQICRTSRLNMLCSCTSAASCVQLFVELLLFFR